MVLLDLVSFVTDLVRILNPKAGSVFTVPPVVTSGVGEPYREWELCCVCLSRLEEDGVTVQALPCRHEFHGGCIRRWFTAQHRTCPLCRSLVDEEDTLYAGEEVTEELSLWFSSFHAAGF
ncbi:hypothetical protein MLD38_031158 [Melastoma candidum]|uniref:Uncharacterized protein n=1 Tax=Melastoma candidum TaxID=119954 RepID=A0ACB9MNV9_9MYRT|nr:hypothetical protein MLD38_031158 [Melastoma candidum]